MATKVRFFLDENMPVVIAKQLKRRGIEAVTVRDLGLLGDEGYVLVLMTLITLIWLYQELSIKELCLGSSTNTI